MRRFAAVLLAIMLLCIQSAHAVGGLAVGGEYQSGNFSGTDNGDPTAELVIDLLQYASTFPELLNHDHLMATQLQVTIFTGAFPQSLQGEDGLYTVGRPYFRQKGDTSAACQSMATRGLSGTQSYSGDLSGYTSGISFHGVMSPCVPVGMQLPTQLAVPFWFKVQNKAPGFASLNVTLMLVSTEATEALLGQDTQVTFPDGTNGVTGPQPTTVVMALPGNQVATEYNLVVSAMDGQKQFVSKVQAATFTGSTTAGTLWGTEGGGASVTSKQTSPNTGETFNMGELHMRDVIPGRNAYVQFLLTPGTAPANSFSSQFSVKLVSVPTTQCRKDCESIANARCIGNTGTCACSDQLTWGWNGLGEPACVPTPTPKPGSPSFTPGANTTPGDVAATWLGLLFGISAVVNIFFAVRWWRQRHGYESINA